MCGENIIKLASKSVKLGRKTTTELIIFSLSDMLQETLFLHLRTIYNLHCHSIALTSAGFIGAQYETDLSAD